MKQLLIAILPAMFWFTASAQFSNPHIITSTADGARSVFAIDLDGDLKKDVLSASSNDSTIAWYKNLGNNLFGPKQIISTNARGATCVNAADLDGDQKIDVISASGLDNKIAWYKNLGNGNFGPQQIIHNNAMGVESVSTADLDGDGDQDILSASRWDNSFSWFENLGNGNFGPRQIFSSSVSNPRQILAADLNNNGLIDIVGVTDSYVVWFNNLGNLSFSPPQQLHYLFYMISACVLDVENDGDLDIVAISLYETALIENFGNGNFNSGVQINPSVGGVFAVSSDLNNDGLKDFCVAEVGANSILYYLNNGLGGFIPAQATPGIFNNIQSIYCSDLDSDGKTDIVWSSFDDDQVGWLQNQFPLSLAEEPGSRFLIFPNPANGRTHIQYGETLNLHEIKIFNQLGSAVTFDAKISHNNIQLDLKETPPGIYFIKITANDKFSFHKLVIQ
jgi:hypothetical protein